jgi:hypothetical protein
MLDVYASVFEKSIIPIAQIRTDSVLITTKSLDAESAHTHNSSSQAIDSVGERIDSAY